MMQFVPHMLFARLYAMPFLKSGLVLVTGKGMGSPGLTRAASRDLGTIQSHLIPVFSFEGGGGKASKSWLIGKP